MRAHRTPRRPGRSASRSALSPSESIPGLSVLARDRPTPPKRNETIVGLSKREENPPQGPHQCLWARLRHRGAASRKRLARSPIPVQESRPGSLSLAGATPLRRPTPCGVGTERRASVPCQLQEASPCCHEPTPPSDKARWEPPRHRDDEGSKPPPPPRRAIAHPRHGITRPLRTD